MSEARPSTRRSRVNATTITSLAVRNADHSARRKSARQIINASEPSNDEDSLANDIWDAGSDDDEIGTGADEESNEDAAVVPQTPSKRDRRKVAVTSKTEASAGRKRKVAFDGYQSILEPEQQQDEDIRGGNQEDSSDNSPPPETETPTKRRRGRPPKPKIPDDRPESPPSHLPPHELYFWSNRPGASKKTSDNILRQNTLLDHEKFFHAREAWADPHYQHREYLLDLHHAAFPQWAFELDNDFSVCLYGYGSKKQLITDFAGYLCEHNNPLPTVIIVNGLSGSSPTLVDLLTTIAGTLIPKSVKLPSTVQQLLPLVIDALDSAKSFRRSNGGPKQTHSTTLPMYLLISSLDAPSLRKAATQAAIATLAAHQNIRLVATVDNPDAPLLWDIAMRGRYRFVHHDTTTFAPWDYDGKSDEDEAHGKDQAATSGNGLDPVEIVNNLLGRSGRRLGGRDGVGYVLRSLPENARHLYRILVAEQIASSAEDEDDDAARGAVSDEQGVDFRVLYHKAREELVCSTEHQLRTLLKEFFDHQMVENRRDAVGTERLFVPFRKEELESLLEDLVE